MMHADIPAFLNRKSYTAQDDATPALAAPPITVQCI